MNWINLRSNACPKCGENLKERNQWFLECERNDCDFSISKKRLQEILEKMDRERTSGVERRDASFEKINGQLYKKDRSVHFRDEVDDNLSGLSNL